MGQARQVKNQKAVEMTDKSKNKVDRAGEETFPASDPASFTTPHLSDKDAASGSRIDRLPPKLPPDIKPANEETRHQDKSSQS